MKKRKNRQRGSITVLVTILLIPSIVLTGLMVDMSRLKLFSSQAVMSADNYGSAILSDYDNILKELYGLFAISQNKEGKDILDNLQKEMKKNFHGSGEGYWPYGEAEVEFDFKEIEGANLGNRYVLETQINDFMQYRIVQVLAEDADGGGILDALSEMGHIEADAEVIKKSEELSKKADDFYEALKKFYEALKETDEVKNSTGKLKNGLTQADIKLKVYTDKTFSNRDDIRQFQENYARYCEIKKEEKNPTPKLPEPEAEEDEADEEGEEDEESEEETDEEIKENVLNEIREKLEEEETKNLEQDISDWSADATASSQNLESLGKKVDKEIDDIRVYCQQVQQALDNGDVSDELKNGTGTGEQHGLQQELENLKKLTEKGDRFYQDFGIAVKSINEENIQKVKEEYQKCQEKFKKDITYLKDGEPEKVEEISKITLDDTIFADVFQTEEYRNTYSEMKECCEESDKAESAKQKKKAAEDAKSKAEEALNEEEEDLDVRNIPDAITGELHLSKGAFVDAAENFTDLLSDIKGYFSKGGLKNAAKDGVAKLFLMLYDGRMFTNRMHVSTGGGEKSEEAESKSGEAGASKDLGDAKVYAESLTGVEFSKKNINYLYGAELEYIFGGHQKSKSNLNDVRNKIVMFRMMMNFLSTYRIKEINMAINTTSEAVGAALTPLAGFAVNIALRTAFAASESAEDWIQLKKAKKVLIFKDSVDDLATGILDDLVDDNSKIKKKGESAGVSSKKKFALDYQQYLQILLLFFTPQKKLAERTGDLISMNVSFSSGESDSLDSLSFKRDEALTAIEASCQGRIDFVAIPEGFAMRFLDADGYDTMKRVEGRRYKFTVTRGY